MKKKLSKPPTVAGLIRLIKRSLKAVREEQACVWNTQKKHATTLNQNISFMKLIDLVIAQKKT